MRRRLSYSNVMATLAVFVALGGTSYAAITITGKNVKNGSLTGADIKKHSVQLNRLRGSLPAGTRGPKGDQGHKGDTGAAGTNGKDGSPGVNGKDKVDGSARAYAAVNGNHTLNAGASKNIASVENFGTGHYCVLLDPSIDPTKVVAIVTPFGASGSSDTAVFADAGGCSAGSDVGVFVLVQNLAGTDKDGAFYLAIP